MEQTYGYTRKVFASYATYRYLYGEVTTTDSKPTSTYPGRVPATLGHVDGQGNRAACRHRAPEAPGGPAQAEQNHRRSVAPAASRHCPRRAAGSFPPKASQ